MVRRTQGYYKAVKQNIQQPSMLCSSQAFCAMHFLLLYAKLKLIGHHHHFDLITDCEQLSEQACKHDLLWGLDLAGHGIQTGK